MSTLSIATVEASHAGHLDTLRKLVYQDFELTKALLQSEHSTVPLVNQITFYITQCGGKLLRPLVLLLMAHALGYKGKVAPHLAASIEYIHTATLLHDDVVDNSTMRRGCKTAHTIWDNTASVLVGDFLYTFAIHKVTHLEGIDLTDINRSYAAATNQIIEGEVLQLMNRHNTDMNEETCFTIIYRKTGRLFELAAHIGSLLANGDSATQQAASDYGKYLGIAFQLMDDILDYQADSEKTGKNLGADLAGGSPTLPLIYAIKQANPKQRALICDAIEKGKTENLSEIINIVESTGAIAYTAQCAAQHIQLAIQALEKITASAYRDGLQALGYFAIHRDH